MKTKILVLALSMFGLTISGQVYPIKTYVSYPPTGGTREMIDNVPSAMDWNNNAIYISGYTRNVTTLRDYTLIKYDTNGVFQWQQSFNYAGLNDRALAITVDNTGNPVITGEATSATNGTDIITRKYSPTGTLLWSATFNGSANSADAGLGVVTDISGNAYVCGYTSNTGTGRDFTVIKYNSLGVQQYVYTTNGTANGDDAANAIAFFGNKLYVTGYLNNILTANDIYLTRLNANNASVNWSAIENGTASGADQALDIKVQGNDVLICGGITNSAATGQDYFFGKYNASNGANSFKQTYDAFQSNDFATSLVLDASNTYAIVGVAQNGSNYEYHTTKYSNAGALTWVSKHKTNTNALNVLPKIAVDNIANHFYVCGLTLNATLDATVYQITPGGNQTWVDYHDDFGMRNANVDLLVDNFGRVYVASLNEQSPNVFNIALIQYKQRPLIVPIDYNNVNEPFSYTHLFYPNYNIIKNNLGNLTNEAVFHTQFAHPQEFICQNSVAFCEYKRDSTKAGKDTVSRVNMVFDGANEFSKVYPYYYQGLAKLNYYLDYTGPNGSTDVQGANRLISPEIYPNIDLHYYSNSNGAKYYFVVKPGGDPNLIRLRFDGSTSTSITGNDLKINSYLGNWTFKKPKIYNLTLSPITPTATGTSGWVSVGGDTYKVNPGTYNVALPLVIEFDKGKIAAAASPTANLNWSTYYGSGSQDYVKDVINDGANNLYILGATQSPLLPQAIGVTPFQANNAGGTDGFVAKFDNIGKLLWTCFIGGSANDVLSSFDIDPIGGDIYCVGPTVSTNLLTKPKVGAPSAPYFASHDPNPSDDWFIFQCAPSGSVCNWLTYYPGNSDDIGPQCKFDRTGNFIFGGSTKSNNLSVLGSSPTYTANYGDTYGGYDCYIMKLSRSTFTTTWSTYIGSTMTTYSAPTSSSAWDFIYDINVNINDDIYMVGSSAGSDYTVNAGVGVSPNTYTQTTNFAPDGIITRFSNQGRIMWSSYFGSNFEDVFYRIKTRGTDVYLCGTTLQSSTFRVFNSGNYYFNTTKASAPIDQSGFFVHYDNSNLLVHSTLIGDENVNQTLDLAYDNVGTIYMVGSSNGTLMDLPPLGNPVGTWSANNNGGSDYFIFTLKYGITNPIWTTYIGGDYNDALEASVTIDGANRLFVTGTCRSFSLFPWNDGGGFPVHYQNALQGSQWVDYDGSITRFNLSPINFVGIHEQKLTNNSILLYPNPANNVIFVKMNNDSKKSSYTVYNNLGQIVLKGNLNNSTNAINISGLAEGIYVIEVIDEKMRSTAKFVKYD
ncbi:MAG TPA: T9SS type A sorting domain-containing protein [Bacteroidia bacterium]|jgi:hypothetical protein|nr:T9SS type A sorting domain-containing protein [Bacteroidia bacterium]